MFDPSVGTWISQDPEGFDAGDADLYRFVGNDPTNAFDPSGLAEMPATPPTRIGPSVTQVDWIRPYAPESGWQMVGPNTWRDPHGTTWYWDAGGGHWDVKPQGGGIKIRIDRNGGSWQHGPRQRGRGGNISGGSLAALGATMIIQAGVAYVYDEYVSTGEEVGTALAVRVGLGRALQILGVAGELPDGLAFDIVRPGYPTIHVILVKVGEQWYFTAWHTERRHSMWYGYYDEAVDDIKLGQVPAYHTPNAPPIPADLKPLIEQRERIIKENEKRRSGACPAPKLVPLTPRAANE